jgi:hypothetical protein
MDVSTQAARPRIGPSLSNFALAGLFLVTWLDPGRLGAGAVAYAVLLMLLEFVVMHSSAFLGSASFAPGPRRARVVALLGLSAFYFVFVAGFALAFGSWWPVTSFLVLTVNRILAYVAAALPSGEEQIAIQRGLAASALLYLSGAFVTVFLPIPRLGITAGWLAAHPLPSSGLWVEEPQRPVVFGLLYFTALGVSEWFGHRWLPVSGLPAARGSSPVRKTA